MRGTRHPRRFLALIFAARIVGALITAGDKSTATSLFVHYGTDGSEIVTGEVVYIEGEGICDPSPTKVGGKVVVSGMRNTCSVQVAYRKLKAAGALALVDLVPTSPPGYRTFEHDDFLGRHGGMTFVQAAAAEFSRGGVDFEAMQGEFLTISPPHNSIYYDMFTSPCWILGVQIIIPMFGLFISAAAFAEAHRMSTSLASNPGLSLARQDHKRVGILICRIEGPSTLLLAIACVLGQQGPQYMPYPFHCVFYTLLTGVSMWTTSLLIILMREQII